MAFQIIEKNGNSYRKNINKTGKCKFDSYLPCICCNPECDYNMSVDDEVDEQMEKIWENVL